MPESSDLEKLLEEELESRQESEGTVYTPDTY